MNLWQIADFRENAGRNVRQNSLKGKFFYRGGSFFYRGGSLTYFKGSFLRLCNLKTPDFYNYIWIHARNFLLFYLF